RMDFSTECPDIRISQVVGDDQENVGTIGRVFTGLAFAGFALAGLTPAGFAFSFSGVGGAGGTRVRGGEGARRDGFVVVVSSDLAGFRGGGDLVLARRSHGSVKPITRREGEDEKREDGQRTCHCRFAGLSRRPPLERPEEKIALRDCETTNAHRSFEDGGRFAGQRIRVSIRTIHCARHRRFPSTRATTRGGEHSRHCRRMAPGRDRVKAKTYMSRSVDPGKRRIRREEPSSHDRGDSPGSRARLECSWPRARRRDIGPRTSMPAIGPGFAEDERPRSYPTAHRREPLWKHPRPIVFSPFDGSSSASRYWRSKGPSARSLRCCRRKPSCNP